MFLLSFFGPGLCVSEYWASFLGETTWGDGMGWICGGEWLDRVVQRVAQERRRRTRHCVSTLVLSDVSVSLSLSHFSDRRNPFNFDRGSHWQRDPYCSLFLSYPTKRAEKKRKKSIDCRRLDVILPCFSYEDDDQIEHKKKEKMERIQKNKIKQ